MRRLFVLPALALSALALVACGESTDDAVSPAVVTVTEKQVVTTPPAPASTKGSVVRAPRPSPARPAARTIKVPDVVGKNHQYAQDTMQAAGLYNLAEEDATGQGRVLLWDRNWVVVSQSPSPGSRVTEGRTIVLRSKKYGE